MSRQVQVAFWILTAAAFVAGFYIEPIYPVWPIIKTAPIWLLAFTVARRAGRRGGVLLTALLLCSLGDVALGYRHFAHSFMLGLLGNLLGHVFYVICFAREYRFRPARLVPILVALSFSASLFYLILPKLGALVVPVLVYVLFLNLLVGSAAFRNQSSYTVLAGALLFMFSDGIIALDRFYVPSWYELVLNPLTYYPAQFLLAHGWLQDHSRRLHS